MQTMFLAIGNAADYTGSYILVDQAQLSTEETRAHRMKLASQHYFLYLFQSIIVALPSPLGHFMMWFTDVIYNG